MSDFATSSGHWYTRTGEPAYEQPNKSKPGEFRATTVADARKLNLVPSVTTILQMEAKPALDNWVQDQIWQATAANPVQDGETKEDYKKRVTPIAREISEAARDRGTLIHGWIEAYFAAEGDIASEALPWVDAVEDALEREFGPQVWLAEKSFASPLGFGGKVDLHSASIVVDFKSKDTDKINFKRSMTFNGERMQLSAYRRGLFEDWESVTMANVYIGRELIDGKAVVKIETHESDYWELFQCYLNAWRITKKFDPSF